ncbi:unnamed protein product [Clonostachys solani]|uniref:Exosome complex component RRP46 n=1 Tax=Clonostachys solani TaxID=160281 RepID=A0A9P0EEA1_9HYPO|nr:unnamed protein product [Clonostachys solani]
MALSSQPAADLAPLPRADGSATFSHNGFVVTAAVNGPVEAPRRDENAFEALVDVIIRPAAGVGGTAERQLESILQSTLRQLIPIRDFPRTMIQITLQIVEIPENAYENAKILQAQLNLPVIPALLHAAILGLLTASIPLKTIVTACTLAITEDGTSAGRVTLEPTAIEARRAKSLHVVGFTGDGGLLLSESTGSFSVEELAKVLELGEKACSRDHKDGTDVLMGDDEISSSSIKYFIRSVMQSKSAKDLHWK